MNAIWAMDGKTTPFTAMRTKSGKKRFKWGQTSFRLSLTNKKNLPMRVIGINGSPHKNGNTSILIQTVFSELEKAGIKTELVQLGGRLVHGCTACGKCREIQDRRCHIKNDLINEMIGKMIEADGIILGSPVYFADITPEMKALIDVAGYVTRGNGHLLRRKVGAGIAAVRAEASYIHSKR
jgi:multimeric flavodoxin WrbA